MDLQTLNRNTYFLMQNPKFKQLYNRPTFFNQLQLQAHFSLHCHRKPRMPSSLQIFHVAAKNQFITACISPSQEVVGGEDSKLASVEDEDEETEVVESKREEFVVNDSIWNQMVEIMKFSGPAIGLWICGPLMSLIDTVVIGQQSSLELAALGPGTVFCDYMSYGFMFLSIATSNMVATSLAGQGKAEVQHQISILLFVGLTCGVLMLFFTKFLGVWALTAFTGPKNAHIIPAANTYVQIRGLAWPAVLVGWVAQSASLGMKDSWGPLKALAVASAVNGIGDIVLCTFLGYGIAGAAWATMVSQIIAGYMMIEALNKKGYNAFTISVPSPTELLQIFLIAAPVFVTMMSKVAFYSLIVYFATTMGTHTVAAHQVMMQLCGMCTVFGEPFSQTAQSFMPELMYGVNQNLAEGGKNFSLQWGTPRDSSHSYANAPSPYLPSTPGEQPMTPSSASYLPGTPGGQPMTPGSGGLDIMSPVVGGDNEGLWVLPDILVNLRGFGEDIATGVVREVLPDGSCRIALGSSGNGEIVTALPSEIDVVVPRKSDKVKIMGGAQRGSTGKLIGVDGSDGIVKVDDTLDVKILDMNILAKLAQHN